MRVLLVSVKSEKIYGGIATWTNYFLDACKNSGIEADLVNTEVVGKRLESESAKIVFSDEYKRTKRIFNELKKHLEDSSCDYSAVHLNTNCGTFGIFRDYLIAKKVKKRKIRLITHYHCDIPDWVQSGVGKHYLKKLCDISDENVVLCKRSQDFLAENIGVNSTLISNFVNDEIVIKGEKTVNDNIETIVFVGRVCKAKGAFEVLELARRFPEITFELVGKTDDEISSLDIPKNAKLAGTMPHEKLIEHLDKADLFLLPSHTEGFSVALTEAMARGIPSVVTDVGANKDMLSDGGGILTEVGNVDQMQKAILDLASKEIRQLMSNKAIEKAKNNYISSVAVKKLSELYED